MGMLIDGVWHSDAEGYICDGAFQREPSALPARSASEIARRLDATAGIVLVASQSCPWSHRTMLVRALKGLNDIAVVVAGGPRIEGYALADQDALGPREKPILHLHQLYVVTDSAYTGRATVPLLWDAEAGAILSNASATIARALDQAGANWRLAPDLQASAIDAINTRIYEGLSNAVYRAGLATVQAAHIAAVRDVFRTLDWLDARLADRRCLFGNQITEADLFLFATLVRFDAIYVPLFRCTRRRLVDYTSLWAYARDVYSWPGIAETVDLDANLKGYFLNDTDNNPHQIVPECPAVDWTEPHGREKLGPLAVYQDSALAPAAEIARADNGS